MAYEGPAEPADDDHVLRFKTARDVGAGGPSAGLTDTQLRATPVPVSQKQYTGVPSSFAFRTANETVFTLAAGERGFIQNCDDAALAVKLGAGASATSLSFILAAGTAADDGRGGIQSAERLCWSGQRVRNEWNGALPRVETSALIRGHALLQ